MAGRQYYRLCMECEKDRARHNDPRTPPLSTGRCLCDRCAFTIYGEVTYEAIATYNETIKDITRRVKI